MLSIEIILMNKSQIAFKKNNRYIEMLNEYDAYSQLLERTQIIKKHQEQIVDVQLNDAEKAAFAKSADAVRAMNADLKSVL